jgi:UrcA family protein
MFTIEKSAAARSSSSRLRVVCACLVAASVTVFTSGVYADNTIPQTTVRFSDLDLSKQQSTQDLYARLQRASRAVCREFEGRSVSESRLYAQCYEQALDTAVERVGNTALTALHEANPALRVAERRAEGQPTT